MAPERLLEIGRFKLSEKIARTIAILVLFTSGKPHWLVYYFSDRRLSMHASRSTHKQGKGLLVLGDLLFGQRIGLYAGAKVLSVKQSRMPESLPRKAGLFESNKTRAEQERGEAQSRNNSGDSRTMVKDRGS